VIGRERARIKESTTEMANRPFTAKPLFENKFDFRFRITKSNEQSFLELIHLCAIDASWSIFNTICFKAKRIEGSSINNATQVSIRFSP